jgi:anaerobic selenocysteine-containing dehydrogenase
LRRLGGRGEGRWEALSWEEALSWAAERLNQIKSTHGARAVAFCQGAPRGLEFPLLARLANTFGSPNLVGISNTCHIPRALSARVTMGFFPVVDYDNPAECYLLWGSNIPDTNSEGVLKPLLMRRVEEGRHLIVVDPRRTELAEKAHLWLQIRPGADAALALGLLHVVISEALYDADFVTNWTVGFDDLAQAVAAYTPEKVAELAWVDAGSIREAARLFARSRPAALEFGNAVEQTIHTFDICRGICCLMAITGNLDVPGGVVQVEPPPVTPVPQLARLDLLPRREEEMISSGEALVPGFPVVPPPFLVRAVLEGRPYAVRGAYIQASNPVMAWASSQDTIRALRNLDFLCVSEIFMTPTAALADLVLPAATHFEFDDIGHHYGLPHGYVLARPKIVDPPPLCWPDRQILNELAKQLGLREYWWDDSREILDAVLAPAGITYEHFVELRILQGPQAFRKYLAGGFPTPSGKVELRSEAAAARGLSPVPIFAGFPEPDDASFPLLLSSAKNPHYFHSAYRQLAGLRKRAPAPVLVINPETARELQLEEGQSVLVETRHGRITLAATLSDEVHPRVVYAEHGWYFPERPQHELLDCLRSNLNALTSAGRLGQAFGTPNLRALPCRIAKH